MARIKFGVGIYGTDNAREAVALARTPKLSATTDSGSAIRT